MPTAECYRCHKLLDDRGGRPDFALYLNQTPGAERVNVHAVCIADEIADGRIQRVSPFAFELIHN